MKRLLLLTALVLLGFISYRYFFAGARKQTFQRAVAGLQTPVTIQELPDHLIAIQAETLKDALAALGYVHGRWHSWPLLFWRQAALGRQAEWFGPPLVPLDSLVHALLLPQQAQRTYARLSRNAQSYLEAYAHGLQAALQERAVRLRDELVLLRITAEPWLPWHSLAIERLMALLMLPDALKTALPVLSTLQSWLHLHGFQHSMAWVRLLPDSSLQLTMRYVYGDLALPFFQEVLIALPNDTLRLVTIPGTLIFLAGQTRHQAWYLLPAVRPATLEVQERATLSLRSVFARFRLPDGNERLLHRQLDGDALVITELAPDTVRLLRWTGLTPVTDLTAWLALLSDTTAPFHLFAGHGLLLTANGQWHLLGQPSVVESLSDGILIGQTDWHRWIAQRLRALPPHPTPLNDTVSLWAQQQLATLLPVLDTMTFTDTLTREAYTLLRNWNASYDAASIGATIFDYWLHQYQQQTGTLPSSRIFSATSAQRLHTAFRKAVDMLALRLGPDLNLWRWERAHPRHLAFPAWSHLPHLPAASRYAPLQLPGEGHPSTIQWGVSALLQELPAPAHWEGWMRFPRPTAFYVRRLWPRVNRFLARYQLSTQPSTSALQLAPPLRTFHLRPRKAQPLR